jgi:sugar-specific transcriptional regulator TrmB
VTQQGRKLKNAVAQRRKCVKAILSRPKDQEMHSVDQKIDFVMISDVKSLVEWQSHAMKMFKSSGQVKERFLTTYEFEWNSFCNDAFNYFFGHKDQKDSESNERYEKYLISLIQEMSKTNLNWVSEMVTSSGKRSDIAFDNGVTVDLKKRPDYFAFIVNIPGEVKSNFRETPLALMALLEKNPGFNYVDITQSANNSNQIEIQIHDKYDMEQIGVAQGEILKYFSEQF